MMGAWGVGITANDLAQDLKLEYAAVFSTVAPEEGVVLLDRLVRETWLEGAEDGETWVDYVYSLADFMWRHGILTGEVKARAMDLLKRRSGEERYREAGTGPAREKALSAFEEKLNAPQPPKRKPRIRVNRRPVFKVGDVLAVPLRPEGRFYFSSKYLGPEEFSGSGGHWVLLRKTGDSISWRSELVPEVQDIWPVFQLGQRCYTELPKAGDWLNEYPAGKFFSDGTIAPYRRQGVQVIENCMDGMPDRPNEAGTGIFFDVMLTENLLIAQRRGCF